MGPARFRQSFRCAGRKPEGPGADPHGKLWMAFRARVSHSSRERSQSIGMASGRRLSGPSLSFPLGCREASFSATSGSQMLAVPRLTKCLAALEYAPSSTRPLMVSRMCWGSSSVVVNCERVWGRRAAPTGREWLSDHRASHACAWNNCRRRVMSPARLACLPGFFCCGAQRTFSGVQIVRALLPKWVVERGSQGERLLYERSRVGSVALEFEPIRCSHFENRCHSSTRKPLSQPHFQVF